jgi:hypothetical protein
LEGFQVKGALPRALSIHQHAVALGAGAQGSQIFVRQGGVNRQAPDLLEALHSLRARLPSPHDQDLFQFFDCELVYRPAIGHRSSTLTRLGNRARLFPILDGFHNLPTLYPTQGI